MPEHQDELLWGAKAIGEAINRSERQTLHLLEVGAIPAKKVGGRHVTTTGALRRQILGGLNEGSGECGQK
jgi:hypothetical protein